MSGINVVSPSVPSVRVVRARPRLQIALLGVLLAALARAAFAADLVADAADAAASFAGAPGVSVVPLTTDGGRVDWSASNGLVAFDRPDRRGEYDVWSMRPDGSVQRCLTCEAKRRNHLPKTHAGNPAWHPDGRFLVMQVQKPGLPRLLTAGRRGVYFTPGMGLANDLWALDTVTDRVFRLTNLPFDRDGATGVLHPHFSSDGRELLWAERRRRASSVESASGDDGVRPAGDWVLMVARFDVVHGAPRLFDRREIRPVEGEHLYESHGFLPRGELVFSGTLDGQPLQGIDLYTYDVVKRELRNLTESPATWDEHGIPHPSGRALVYMSSEGHVLDPARPWHLPTDWYLMGLRTGESHRLTHFNPTPSITATDRPRERARTAADASWSPDGRSFVGYVITDARRQRGVIVRVDLGAAVDTALATE